MCVNASVPYIVVCANVQGEVQFAMRDAPPPQTCNVGGRVWDTGTLVPLSLSCLGTGGERRGKEGWRGEEREEGVEGRGEGRRGGRGRETSRLESPANCANFT